MSLRFVSIDRNQPLLLPPDLRDWIPEDDLVHFVIDAVEGMSLSVFKVNARGTGSAQYPPHMMLSLLIYCYANGIFSSRRIERATHRDIAVRYLTGDTHPDHDTICAFRRENFDAVAACFVHVLELARELKLLERRPRAGGRDRVDHPTGGHDDFANVVTLAAALALSRLSPS